MNQERKIMLKVVILVIALCMAGVSWAAPMGTAFTYQGRLADANSPADDLYDFEFEVYEALNGGSQQGSTVSKDDVDVADGYFTVLLDFGSDVFTGDARWLEIAVRPGASSDPCDFATLSPRQELTPTPYAMQTRGIFVDDLLDVGIGTLDPAGKLHVDGGKAFSGDGGTDLVFKAQDGGDGWMINNDGAPGGDIILLPGEGGEEIGVGSPGPDGNVGIGTTEPARKLEVRNTEAIVRLTSDGSVGSRLELHNINEDPDTLGFINFSHNPSGLQGQIAYSWNGMDFKTGDMQRMRIDQDGNVGIGTTSPGTKLHIGGGSDASLGGGGFLVTGSESGTNMVIDDNEIIARNNGSSSKLYLNKGSGNVVVSVLEITGGSDLAEPFEVAGAESIEPGMVVAIDPEHPGKLRIAEKAYDRTVAGIVSGANGINPGMTMSQEETATDGSFLVALTGRVYVLADASNGLIEPGDLLTTSQTPGHAMKVTDYSKAHGAILGKAMSSLDQGQGLVLVLVTLQ